MPARIEEIHATLYRSPLGLPADAITSMKGDPRSNLILAKLEKYRSGKDEAKEDDFWIVCTTARRTSRGTLEHSIDFIVSCTYGVVGKYPLFIYSKKHEEDLNEDYVDLRMRRLVLELLRTTSTRRIYSVFANEIVSRYFSKHWTQQTGIQALIEPYYHAWFSYCSRDTIKQAPKPRRNYETRMRLAVDADVHQVADLCYGFARDSPPFELTRDGSLEEAQTLVGAKQVWVLEVYNNHSWSISCIVCLTRSSETVAAITKVYTPPYWRQKGFAHQLVNYVTRNLLLKENKKFVVLYVGLENPAAFVYDRVGFTGLNAQEGPRELVERWLEIGFDRSKVDLGQW